MNSIKTPIYDHVTPSRSLARMRRVVKHMGLTEETLTPEQVETVVVVADAIVGQPTTRNIEAAIAAVTQTKQPVTPDVTSQETADLQGSMDHFQGEGALAIVDQMMAQYAPLGYEAGLTAGLAVRASIQAGFFEGLGIMGSNAIEQQRRDLAQRRAALGYTEVAGYFGGAGLA